MKALVKSTAIGIGDCNAISVPIFRVTLGGYLRAVCTWIRRRKFSHAEALIKREGLKKNDAEVNGYEILSVPVAREER